MILPIEKEVVTLETAKKMKSLGCRQDSKFAWDCHWCGLPMITTMESALEHRQYLLSDPEIKDVDEFQSIYAAYTIGEIGFILPRDIKKKDYYENEAEARGLMWCYLVEKGFIKPNAN